MTTVKETWNMACPKCGQDDALKVAVTTWKHLTSHGTEGDGDHEWDSESNMMCDCGWGGRAGDCYIARVDYKCPRCNKSDLRVQLPVVFSMDAEGRLAPEGPGEDDLRSGIAAYSEGKTAFCMCNGCGHEGIVDGFYTEGED